MARKAEGAYQTAGPGALTGGADMAVVIGTSAGTVLWNKAQRANGSDTLWAVAELLVGGVVAMNVATAGAPHLRNVSLGIAVGGATYLIDKLIP